MAEIAGIRRQFIRTAMEAPFLAREEERGLAVRWKDERDERALHRLISAHMRLVIALAGRFRHYGLPMADLVQEGHVGLMEAAARFEPELVKKALDLLTGRARIKRTMWSRRAQEYEAKINSGDLRAVTP